MKICSKHLTEAKWKTGTSQKTGKDYAFWACDQKDNGDYCHAEIIDKGVEAPQNVQTVPYTPKPQETPKQEVDWDTKDRQSMAQTAMKSASEIVSALIIAGRTDYKENPITCTEEMAKDLFEELLRLKSSS